MTSIYSIGCDWLQVGSRTSMILIPDS